MKLTIQSLDTVVLGAQMLTLAAVSTPHYFAQIAKVAYWTMRSTPYEWIIDPGYFFESARRK